MKIPATKTETIEVTINPIDALDEMSAEFIRGLGAAPTKSRYPGDSIGTTPGILKLDGLWHVGHQLLDPIRFVSTRPLTEEEVKVWDSFICIATYLKSKA